MRKTNINLTGEFLHPNARLVVREMQITLLAIDKIYEIERKRADFNALSAIRKEND